MNEFDARFDASHRLRFGKHHPEQTAIVEIKLDGRWRWEIFGQEEIRVAEDAAERRVETVAGPRAFRQRARVWLNHDSVPGSCTRRKR